MRMTLRQVAAVTTLVLSAACNDDEGSLLTGPVAETTPNLGEVAAAITTSGTTVVKLPAKYLNYTFPLKTGQTIIVPAGGNLQNALNAAKRGDEIVLTAGATYSGNFTLPAKSGTAANGWIIIRSDKYASLPSMGTRVKPSNAAVMAKIQ